MTLSEKYEKIGDSLVFTVPYVYLTIISDKGVTASLTSTFGIQMINFNPDDEGYVPNTIGINSKIRENHDDESKSNIITLNKV